MSSAATSSPERWKRLEALFYQASDMPQADRSRFLASACADDPSLQSEVEALLTSSERTLSDLFQPALETARDLADCYPLTDKLIGHWRILSPLGDGGMGRVYLAARADDSYEQKVAIKIMRSDFGRDAHMLLRFRAERQILAKLNHTNIARLLDGGVTAEGLPYLVMEYVEGVPIDSYCREHKLSVQDRVALFESVCSAVDYAHRQLVIHRDIKPSNILVTADGVAKLLDFGIARLLSPEYGDMVRTRVSERLMTPDYASPEQVRGDLPTTATDVYALGILLYELLAGSRPFRLKTNNPLELARTICELTPPAPSTCSTLPDAAYVRGDLDCIVMMAIRKEPERRYPSASRLAADIDAHLHGYPLQARTDSWSYRTETFIRRHRWPVAASLTFVIALLVFAVSMVVLARRAERQREVAERERSFMSELFRSASPDVAKGETITARSLLDRGAKRIDHELAGEPQVQASLLQTIADAYRSLGLLDESERFAQRALHLNQVSFGANSPQARDSIELLAELDRDRGRYDQAEPLLNRVLKLKRAEYGSTSPQAANVMAELGECYYWEAKDDQAIVLLRQTLAIDRQNGPDYGASTRNYLALTLERKGDFDEARQLLEEAVGINRHTEGPNSPDYAVSLHNLGSSLIDRGDLFGAEARLRECLEIRRRILGQEHPDLTLSLNNVGYVLLEQGNWREAEPFLRENLALSSKLLGPDNPRIASAMNNWARVLEAKGDYAQAEEAYLRIRTLLERLHASQTWPFAQITNNLGLLQFDEGHYTTAEKYAREALALRRKLGGDQTPAFANALIDLGEDRAFQGDLKSADQMLRQAVAIRKSKLWSGHPDIASAEVRLAEVLLAERQSLEAEQLLKAALHQTQQEPFRLPAWQIAQIKTAYAECLRQLGRPREAALYLTGTKTALASEPHRLFRADPSVAL